MLNTISLGAATGDEGPMINDESTFQILNSECHQYDRRKADEKYILCVCSVLSLSGVHSSQ